MLLFETGSPDALMLPGYFLTGGLGSTLGLTGAIASPLELLLLLTFGLWLAGGITSRRLAWRGGRLGRPMLAFFLTLVFGLVRGAVAGGDLNIALWESRFLFYSVICFVLAANTIRTHGHLKTLITIGMLAMAAYALEGAYRRIVLLDTHQVEVMMEFAYSHEVVIFLGALPLLVLAQQVFGAPRWQRLLGPLFLAISLYTLLATERRAGYIAIIVAFLAFTLVLLMAHRKAFFILAVPLLLFGTVYIQAFWNDTSLLGQPARAIRSLSEPDPRDAASNLYRDIEKIDVQATILENPVLGVGFGREFLFVAALPDLSWWPFWHFEPHHNILWVWLKTGIIGFIAFWVLIGGAIARAAHHARTLRRPDSRVFAVLALVGIIATVVFCYVDLGLVSARVTVFLGTILGTLSVLDQLHD
jgi:O-Antigen ligase